MSESIQTLTLTDFLLARIAEDDELAASANTNQRLTWATTADTAASVAGHNAGIFILFNPPARVLAECEAKRRIVGRHRVLIGERACRCCNDWWPCPDVRDLAAAYADHPDWREEWRP